MGIEENLSGIFMQQDNDCVKDVMELHRNMEKRSRNTIPITFALLHRLEELLDR